jgi:hypothetical protein
MATRRRMGVVDSVNEMIHQMNDQDTGEYLPAEIPEDFEETATDRVASMLASINGMERSELKVYKLNQGALEYCQGFKPEQFEEGNFDLLRDRFGPGEFELRLYATHPQTRKFGIRSKLRVKMSEINRAAVDNTLPSGLAQVLGTIASGQERMLDALVQMKQQPQKDPMEEMTKMLSMMTMMRQAMGMDNQPRAGSSIGEIVEAIRELRSAADEVAPQREEPESMMAMLPKVLDIVSAGMGKGQAQAQPEPEEIQPVQLPPSFYQQPQPQQSNEQVPVAPAAPTPEPVIENQQPQSEDEVNHLKYIFKLRAYLSALVDFAVKLAPAETAAQFVVDKLPDELIEIMELPNWFEQLAHVAPEVKKHEDYLRKVRDLALSMIDYDDEPEAPAAD